MHQKTSIAGAFSALGTALMSISTCAAFSGLDPDVMRWFIIAGGVASALGKFFGGLFAADAKTTEVTVVQPAAPTTTSNAGTQETKALALGLLLMAAGTASAWELTDLNGISHSNTGRTRLVIIGPMDCPARDRMVADSIAPLVRDYPEMEALAVFPDCNTAAARAWQTSVPGASNLCPCLAPISSLALVPWQEAGYPQPFTMLYAKDGSCVTNWAYLKTRPALERPLSRQLLDLRMVRSRAGPIPIFRTTCLPWQVQAIPASSNTFLYRLYLP